MLPLADRLNRGRLLLDGAMGTMLYAFGHSRDEPSAMAVLNAPGTVKKIHAAYRDAGAHFLTTNTFLAHRLALERGGLGDRFEVINRTAVTLAREAAEDHCYVMASIGPPGRRLSTLGDRSFGEAERAYREQMALLEALGVDGFLLETFTDLLELQAALQAARDTTCLPVIASVALVGAQVEERLLTPEAAARVAEAMGAKAVGINCMEPRETVSVLSRMRSATSLPLMARPSAGLPDRNGSYQITPEEWGRWGVELLQAGARLLGGCCGTTPAHIAQLRTVFSLVPEPSPDGECS